MLEGYWGVHFVEFFRLFFYRMALFLQGNVPLSELAIDEIQVLTLLLIGVSSAVLGSFLLLRKMTMLANSISHTILLGLVGAILCIRHFFTQEDQLPVLDFQILFLASLLASLLTVFLTDVLTRTFKVARDASIGIVFTFLFALGVVLVTLFTRNSHAGTEVIMGNIDMLTFEDLKLAFYVTVCNLSLILLFYKEYKAVAFDEQFARLSGISSSFFTYLLMLQTSATIVASLRVVGVVLILSQIVLPVLSARLWTKRLLHMILLSSLLASITGLLSVALARHCLSAYQLPLSTAGLSVLCNLIIWTLAALTSPSKGILKRSIFSSKCGM
jgi:manganese/zinc/iron transport system permease protein